MKTQTPVSYFVRIASVVLCGAAFDGFAPNLSASQAKDHIGEFATVCGHVVGAKCQTEIRVPLAELLRARVNRSS